MNKDIFKSVRRAVIVPSCMLAPGIQANAKKKENSDWRKLFLELLVANDINILTYTCPELMFGGMHQGLKRKNHGISFYENLEGFDDYCERVSEEILKTVDCWRANGEEVISIMGIEHSPTCAVNYMYTNKGTQRRAGILMDRVIKTLEESEIAIIGINKSYPRKALEELKLRIEKRERR